MEIPANGRPPKTGRFQCHVFICTNERSDGECCSARGAFELLRCMKQRARALGVDTEGGLMINKSGCFGLCQSGPNVVVYPSGDWLTVSTAGEAEALIDRLAAGIT
ncbi:MAG: hypothetical protein RL617_193 [Pseudomonadota bacterium]|jgi:(2Fe-2S) ferredoxin